MAGPRWALWLMAGVVGCAATCMAVLFLESRGVRLPKAFLYLAVFALLMIPMTSFFVMAWVVTGSSVVSVAIGAILGYIDFGIIGWFVRRTRASSSAAAVDSGADRARSEARRATSGPGRSARVPREASSRPRAKTR